MVLRSWWPPLAAGLAGLAGGLMLAPRFAAAPAPTLAADSDRRDSPAPASPATPPGTLSLDDLRRVVREELAAAGRKNEQSPEAPASDPEPPNPAQVAALSRANQLLDAAIVRRHWTEADVDAMRAEFHQLTVEQQAEVMRRYALAVNQGRLLPQTERVPF